MPKQRTIENDADRVKRLARQTDKLIREQTLSTQTNADLLRALLELAARTEPDYTVVSNLLLEIASDNKHVHKLVRERAMTMHGHLDGLHDRIIDGASNQV